MTIEKENFLRSELIPFLQRLDPHCPPRWGKMNVQQMIEHYAFDAVRNANGTLRFDNIVTPAAHLQKYRDFLLSDKPFRENTINPLMAEEPPALRFNTVQAAIGALQEELIRFFRVYEADPGMVIRNPIFGDLNFEENVQLLYKHALHHLNQFGITVIQ
jgi:hypothetical protein